METVITDSLAVVAGVFAAVGGVVVIAIAWDRRQRRLHRRPKRKRN